MYSAYVWQRLVQGQGKTLTLFLKLQMGYSSPSVIALVYDFTFLYKKNWFHPVTYGGRHDCFRFRKHPSSCLLLFSLPYYAQVYENAVLLFLLNKTVGVDVDGNYVCLLLCKCIYDLKESQYNINHVCADPTVHISAGASPADWHVRQVHSPHPGTPPRQVQRRTFRTPLRVIRRWE